MRKGLTGYATLTDPIYGMKEADTFTCMHCQNVRRVKPMCDPADMGGLCKICMGLICEKCVGKGCDPFEEKLKRQEKSGLARRWMEECS